MPMIHRLTLQKLPFLVSCPPLEVSPRPRRKVGVQSRKEELTGPSSLPWLSLAKWPCSSLAILDPSWSGE